MSKKQITERAKFERNLNELKSLLDRFCAPIEDADGKVIGHAVNDEGMRAELQSMAVAKGLFSNAELNLRQKRHEELGRPLLDSQEWLDELERLKRLRKPRSNRLTPASSINTDPDDTRSLYWQVLMLAARKARGEAVEPIVLPSQSGGAWRGLDGKSPPQSLTGAEARRLYRWLWRIAPGLLNACDDKLRKKIGEVDGTA